MSLYKEDVYETEDPPFLDPIDLEENFENNELEKIHIDSQGAKKRFNNCLLDSGNADFSDSIATRTKRGYKASEIYEGDPVDEDHFEEKYNRICAEVKQLLADSQKREKQPVQINKSDISFLHDMLKSMGELSARAAGQPEVRVLRPAGMQMSNFPSLRPSSVNISSLNQQQMAQSNFAVNQELQNYRGRIVAGSSVQEFNDIIDNFVVEYQRVVDDRTHLLASHREYVNHLKLTHQAAQDIKDNKISHLEQMVDQLQNKTVLNIKQEQLRVVKQGTEPWKDAQMQGQDNQQANDQGIQQIIVGGGGGNDQMES